MPKRSNLVSETPMYSIHPGTQQVVEHHLPWNKNDVLQAPHFEKYLEKGFTFERPIVDSELFGAKVIVGGEVSGSSNGREPLVVKTLPPKNIPKGYYYCQKCKKKHMEFSAQGRRHQKHKGG